MWILSEKKTVYQQQLLVPLIKIKYHLRHNMQICNLYVGPLALVFMGKSTIYIKLATLVKGDPKAPFSIATTPRCRRGHYSWITPLYP